MLKGNSCYRKRRNTLVFRHNFKSNFIVSRIRLFNPKWQQLNERNAIYKGSQLRADRILLSEKECVIVDYKRVQKKTSI